MSSRQEKKAEARAAREQAEAQAAATARRKRRIGMLTGAVLVAAIVVAIAVAVSAGGGGGSSTEAAAKGPAQGASDVAALLQGIPQHGNTLGSPKAPVTLVEFGDLKCPVCRSWDLGVLPTVVNKYVRTGKLRLQYRPQAFVGEQFNPGDSPRAAKFALAAAEQDRMWSFNTLFYRNQQDETTRYVSDAFLRKIGSGVPGLNVQQAFRAMGSAKVANELKASQTAFAANGFSGTPSFLLGGPGRRLSPLNYQDASNPAEFTNAIDALLKK